MSIQYDRRQLETKRKAQADSAKKAAEQRAKEAQKRAAAAKAEQAAIRASSPSQAQTRRREAIRALEAANKHGKNASSLETKAAGYGADAAKLQVKISKAESLESQRLIRQQAISQRAAERQQRQFAQQLATAHGRVAVSEEKLEKALKAISTPKVEKLRILMLGASPEGDLRIGREHSRIRRAVEAALHRDQVEIEVRLSATRQDLQEGISRFRPHVVHFSGHGNEQLIGLEDDIDGFHEGVVVTASAFASACQATDHPPTLIVLNACESAGTANALVNRFAPMAIGMIDSIEDADALSYSSAFYSSIANGHSVGSAHMAGRAAIELTGGQHELPHLAAAPGIDPVVVNLVIGDV